MAMPRHETRDSDGRQPEGESRSARQRAAAGRKSRVARWARRVVLAALALGIAGAIVTAWLPKPVAVDAEAARRGPLRVTVDEDGRTRVRDKYVVASPLAGALSRIELRPGDAVTTGQVIARIVPLAPPLLDARSRAVAQARVAAARATLGQSRATSARAMLALELAKVEAQRHEDLAQKEAASPQALERARIESRTRAEEVAAAESGEQVASHELEQAEAALAYLSTGARAAKRDAPQDAFTVASPTDGRVLRVLQESEAPVQAGTPLVEIGDPARLEIVVDVLTADAVHVAPGAKVSIERWGGGEALGGRVRQVEPSAFTRVSALGVDEQRVNVIIDLSDPRERWQALGDGYRVDAKIVVWEGEDVLTAPAGAVFRRGDGWATFIVQNGRAALRPVEIGHRNGMVVEVTKGLEAGDRVVLHPSDRIVDGVQVEVR